MRHLRKLTLLAIACGFAGFAIADELDMQGTDGTKNMVGPASGTSAESVEAAYGSPIAKKAPVGDPPITRWDYDNYSVYFEHDLVLQSVLHAGEVIERNG